MINDFRLLTRLSTAIASTRDTTELLRTIVTELQSVFGFYDIGLFVVNEAEDYCYDLAVLDPSISPSAANLSQSYTDYAKRLYYHGSPIEFMVQQSITAEGPVLLDFAELTKQFADYPAADVLAHLKFRDCLITTLQARSELIGMFCLNSLEKDHFRPEQFALFQAVADQVAVALSHVLANEEVLAQKQRIEQLLTISQAITEVKDRKQLLKTIYERIRPIFPYDSYGLFVLTEDKQYHYELVDAEVMDDDPTMMAIEQQYGAHHRYEHAGSNVEHWMQAGPGLFRLADHMNHPQASIAYQLGWRRLIAGPLTYGGEAIGMLCFASEQEDFYTEQHLPMFEAISEQVSVAAANVLANERVLAQKQRIEQLLTISQAITEVQDRKQLLKTIYERIQPIFPYDSYGLFVLTEDKQHHYELVDAEIVNFWVQDAIEQQHGRHYRYHHPGSVVDTMMQQGSGLFLIEDFLNDHPQLPMMHDAGLRQMIGGPLTYGGEAIGMICFNSKQEDFYTETYLPLFTAIAEQMSVAVANVLANERLVEEKQFKETLLGISEAVASIHDRKQLLKTIFEQVKPIFGFYDVGLFVLDEEGNVSDWATVMPEISESVVNEAVNQSGVEKIPFKDSALEWVFNQLHEARGLMILPYEKIAFDRFPDYYQFQAIQAVGYQESLMALLNIGGKHIGMLAFNSLEADFFSASQFPLFQAIADQLAVAVNNVMSSEKVLKREQEKTQLLKITEGVTRLRSLPEFLQYVMEILQPIFRFEDVGVFLLSEEGQFHSDVAGIYPNISESALSFKIVEQGTKKVHHPDSLIEWMMAEIDASDRVKLFDFKELNKKFPDYYQFQLYDFPDDGYRDCLAANLRVGDRTLGMFCINAKAINFFPPEQHTLFKNVTEQLSVAVGNIMATEQLLEEKQFKETLLGISEAVASIQDRQQMFKVIYNKVSPYIPMDYLAVIVLDNQDTSWQDLVSSKHHFDPQDPRSLMAVGLAGFHPVDSMTRKTTQQTGIITKEELLAYQDFPLSDFIERSPVQHFMYTPLKTANKVFGSLILNSFRKNAYNEAYFPLFQAIADQLAVAVSNVLANEQIRQKADEKALEVELIKALELHDGLPEKFEAIADILQNHLSFRMIGCTTADTAQPFCHYLMATGKGEYQVLDKGKLIDLLALSNQDFYKLQQQRKRYHTLTDFPEGGTTELLATHIANKWQMGSILSLSVPLSQHTNAYIDLFAQKKQAYSTEQLTLMERLVDTLALALDRQLAQIEIARLNDQLRQENEYLLEEVTRKYHFSEIIGQSDSLQRMFRQIEQVASTDATVLVQGETGTGKELVARAIHQASPRSQHLLVKINCAAIPESLFESELFGHEKGAFTGAMQQRIGKFELAHRGTVFLDEIGELPLSMQAKLLRVLQEQEFERVGGNIPIKSDFRVVAATNRTLLESVATGKFRADLYYRLSTFPIGLTPLRERPEDIPLLAEHFARQYSRHIGQPYRGFTKGAMRTLKHGDFPGNVRELRNIVEHAVIVASGRKIDGVLSKMIPSAKPVLSGASPLPPSDQITEAYISEQKDALERQALLKVLEATHWRVRGKKGAAQMIGLNPSTLESRMKKLGIER
ncbi:sigma 54-interacting transcriptional regulator [Tunicatimonas pelagia]|uniref:sigma 54-interacting transcriptional regulator n=1 Tax=Tunicatimonas pelagia TaxID=931531 RepID=UPI0026661BA1|nr:sigma 54-interacting transcriptional regulator [Tunicatimonas pelagia]WKN44830.1 sigma 54-interacting transcriptional regulator [Tunicatimonas pelagia]